jgi:hypothetical protein
MFREEYYRKRIRPEHWDEFLEHLGGTEDPSTSAQAQAQLDMQLHFAEQRITSDYPDLYPDDNDGE